MEVRRFSLQSESLECEIATENCTHSNELIGENLCNWGK